MEPRVVLAALVASLVSQALLSLLLVPSPIPIPIPNPTQPPPAALLHFLSSSQIAAAAAASLLSRKRKSPQSPHPDQDQDQEQEEEEAAARPHSNPDHFKLSFRMSSSTFEWLSGLLDPLLDCRDPPGSPLLLPSPARLAIALSRLASGAPYPDIARRFAVPESTARFCTKILCRVLCTNFRFWIAFPSPPASSSAAFASLSGGINHCCGALACARYPIPHGRSVAAQIVADASSRILSIAAGFRGERGDAGVLRCSSLYKDVEEGRLLGCSQYFVGDTGYPLLPWLMVPFADPEQPVEDDFNALHSLMCRPARKALSSLADWGVMSRLTEEEDGKVAVACIGTCAILHNVLLMREDYSAPSDATEERMVSGEEHGEGAAEGLRECSADEKALALRSMLAARAAAIRSAGQSGRGS